MTYKAPYDSDDADSANHSGSTHTHRSRSGTTTAAAGDQISKKETKHVFRLRVLVCLVLAAAAAAVSAAVFVLTKRSEADAFESQYDGIADKLIDSFESIIYQMSSITGLAVLVTSNSGVTGSQWPYATISDFHRKARGARERAGVLFVSTNPIVTEEELPKWEEYVLTNATSWIEEGLMYQEKLGMDDVVPKEIYEKTFLTDRIVDPLHSIDEFGTPKLDTSEGPYMPRWQSSPVLKDSVTNENLFQKRFVGNFSKECIATRSAVLGGISGPPGGVDSPDFETSFFAAVESMWEGKIVEYEGDPMAKLYIPLFDQFNMNNATDREVVGVLIGLIHWKSYFEGIFPPTERGIYVVLHNTCHGVFTFKILGEDVMNVGPGDLHDTKYSSEWERTAKFTATTLDDGTVHGIPFNQDQCPYELKIYPSEEYEARFVTNQPFVATFAVVMVFAFAILCFFIYDRLVEKRQGIVLKQATKSTAIVSSLFPRQVRDRLMEAQDTDSTASYSGLNGSEMRRSSGYSNRGGKPIADLFHNCTVFFCDIAGFTAWSSTRAPAEVFILLQTVYQEFDAIAKRRKVFKVETIGDSYLAVTGLPDPQTKHAVIMAKFAHECKTKFAEIVKELEVSLGPECSDLSLRLGLHSGPVTAGVLKGDRARFQLFGDAVNTASRMESTGKPNKIQVSQETANLIEEAGKAHWLTPRPDKVKAKGKGLLTTYWLNPSRGSESDAASPLDLSESNEESSRHLGHKFETTVKEERLISWVTELLLRRIRQIVASRLSAGGEVATTALGISHTPPEFAVYLDEIQESIPMSQYNNKKKHSNSSFHQEAHDVEIPTTIIDEVKAFVRSIAKMYKKNQFHNFEHACHVTVSCEKLLSRVFTNDQGDSGGDSDSFEEATSSSNKLYDYTHGIAKDPIASFAIVFSALIHDADHRGVSNDRLGKEEPMLNNLYRGKSVAEQHSLDIAWDVLMESRFTELRSYIFGSKEELLRFRMFVVNMVLATDIFDKELNDLRTRRWDLAFSGRRQLGDGDDDNDDDAKHDLKATLVLEHIIQASDVSHTMQHWHIYQRWNRRLFREMHAAYKTGRMEKDPAEFWYEGELAFFDNYVIPLAKKLKEDQVFGVSSDEYFNYAVTNRAEWESRGKEVVEMYMQQQAEAMVQYSV